MTISSVVRNNVAKISSRQITTLNAQKQKKKKPTENAIVANKPAGSNVIRPNNPNKPVIAKSAEKPANPIEAQPATEKKPNNRNKNRNKPTGPKKPSDGNPNAAKPDNRIIPNKKNESKEQFLIYFNPFLCRFM